MKSLKVYSILSIIFMSCNILPYFQINAEKENSEFGSVCQLITMNSYTEEKGEHLLHKINSLGNILFIRSSRKEKTNGYFSYEPVEPYSNYAKGKGSLFLSQDGGLTWSRLPNIYNSTNGDVSFLEELYFSKNSIYAVGMYFENYKFQKSMLFKLSKNNFKNWQVDSFEPMDLWIKDDFGDQILLTKQYIDTKAYIYHQDTSSLIEYFSFPNGKIKLIEFVEADDGWVLSEENKLYHTIDRGNTWIEKIFPNLNTNDFTLNSSGKNYLYLNDNNRFLYTNDAGTTWKIYSFPEGNSISDISFLDTGHGFLIYREQLYETTDAGVSWQKIFPQMDSSEESIKSYTWLTNTTGFLISDKNLYKTEDGSKTWTKVDIEIDPFIYKYYYLMDKMPFCVNGM